MQISPCSSSRCPYSDATGLPHSEKLAVKRPLNAFMLFAKEERKKLSQIYENQLEISRILGRRWKTLSHTEKVTFIKKAESLRTLHKIEYPEYKYKPKPKKVRRGDIAKCKKEINKGSYTIVKYVTDDEESDDEDQNEVEVLIEIADEDLLHKKKPAIEVLEISDDDADRDISNRNNALNLSENALKCEFCDFSCGQKFILKTHLSDVHNLPLYCGKCGFRTIYKEHLRIHKRNVHRRGSVKLKSKIPSRDLEVLDRFFETKQKLTEEDVDRLSRDLQIQRELVLNWFKEKMKSVSSGNCDKDVVVLNSDTE